MVILLGRRMGFIDTDETPVDEERLRNNVAAPQPDIQPLHLVSQAGRYAPLHELFDEICLESVLQPFFLNKFVFEEYLWASEKVALAFGLFESQLWFFTIILLENAKTLKINRGLIAWSLILVLEFSGQSFKQHKLEELINSLSDFSELPNFTISQVAARVLYMGSFPRTFTKRLEKLVCKEEDWTLLWNDSDLRGHPYEWSNSLEFTQIKMGESNTSSFISLWLARFVQNKHWWSRGVLDKKHLVIKDSIKNQVRKGNFFIAATFHERFWE